MINSIRKMKSEISLYQDGEHVFSGRVLNDTTDFNGNKSVQCEGELAYFFDSVQRKAEYHDISVENYYRTIIANHNQDVSSEKRFNVGAVTVTDPNDSLYRFSDYENTWELINDKLVNRLGGYVRVRHKDGQRLLDYVDSYGNINPQVIRFGDNLLDLVKEVRGEDLATVIIPLGAISEETDERHTISGVNNGLDYIEDEEAAAIYGRIVKTVEFDDVTVASNLLRKGYEVLAQQKLLSICVTLSAVDLHLLDVNIERIKAGDLIRVVSKPHNIDEMMLVRKVELDIGNPQNSKITLGTTKKTLAESNATASAGGWDYILGIARNVKEQVGHIRTEVAEAYSEITKSAEEIKSEVRDNYLMKDELETIQRDFTTSISQNSSEIRMDFTEITNSIINQVSENQSLLEEYIRFKGALIEMGRVGNAFTTELSHEELAFKENGQKIAYISNQQLVITNAEIRNMLSLGQAERGWFDFIPRTTGNLSIKWRNATEVLS